MWKMWNTEEWPRALILSDLDSNPSSTTHWLCPVANYLTLVSLCFDLENGNGYNLYHRRVKTKLDNVCKLFHAISRIQ